MVLTAPRVVLVLAVMLVASACGSGAEREQRPDGGSGTNATGGAESVSGSGGASGASDTGGNGGSSGSGPGASGSGGTSGAGGTGGAPSTGGAGGAPATGGAGGTGASSAGCPAGLEGPALVNVPAPADAEVSSYCVDMTEVTNSQYAAFLAASVATSGQEEACAWNDGYTPVRDWPVVDKDDFPVANVDWCDAYAYCEWAGKHLCGRIGGGENDFYVDFDDAAESEWFNACSAGGTSTYPYGDDYAEAACVGADYNEPGVQQDLDAAQPVGAAACEGGYGGLQDLSGNVFEWENSCTGEDLTFDTCRMRGGSYATAATSLTCAVSTFRERDYVSGSVGFRCCADAM